MDEVSRLLNIYELSETYKELEDLPKVMELEGKPFLDNLKTELDETAASLDKCYVKIAELLEV